MKVVTIYILVDISKMSFEDLVLVRGHRITPPEGPDLKDVHKISDF